MDDPASRKLFSQALPQAISYAEEPKGWLVLTGPSGSGKTHLAAAIANRCIERELPTFFIVCADLLDHLRSSYSPSGEITYDELFEKVRNVPLLILDDLSAHSATPWAQEKLFQIINHRYNNRLPMVVTLNEPLTRIRDDSLRTRLDERGGVSNVLPLAHSNSRLSRGIGEIHHSMLQMMTFDNFDLAGGLGSNREDQESLANAYTTAKTFASDPDGWLLFTGVRGCGKTHLAVAIAGESLRQGRQVLFAFVPTLLDHLRSTFSPNSPIAYDELFEQLNTTPLLVLDDLGAEKSTPWAEEKLYQIVIHRYNARIPTVITTSSTLEQLEENRPSIYSRLVDSMLVNWESIRAPNFRDQRR